MNFSEKYDEYLAREHIIQNNKKKATSYYGVSKKREKYAARTLIDGKYIYIKVDKEQLVCAKAYDKYIVENNIPHRKLNFPEDYPEYDPDCEIKTLCEKTDNKKVVRLILNSNQDAKVFIDEDEYDKIKYYSWLLSNEYVSAMIKNKTTPLSHFVLGLHWQNKMVDHIDSNILNNCKNNLRITNYVKNSQNKIKSKTAISKYHGVFFYNYNGI